MLIWIFQLVIILLSVLVAVAFITLLERAYMGVTQRRRGPNKISFWGLFQPVLDGVKLMLKSHDKTYNSNFLMFSLVPSINLLIFLFFWLCMPYLFNLLSFSMSSLFLIVLLGMISFGLLLSGWISNSKYALFGSLRSMVQSISYEICLSLIILMILSLKDSFQLTMLWSGFLSLESMFTLFLSVPIILMILAECGRTPFDLMEAESELVSGYNVEFSSVEFAFLFMSEYGMLIMLSILFSVIIYPMMSGMISILIMSLALFMRYTLPRLRYDFLMDLMWKSLLPSIIFIWIMMFNMKCL